VTPPPILLGIDKARCAGGLSTAPGAVEDKLCAVHAIRGHETEVSADSRDTFSIAGSTGAVAAREVCTPPMLNDQQPHKTIWSREPVRRLRRGRKRGFCRRRRL